MKYICPLVIVEDVERSRAFYRDVLGQTVKFDFGENVTFKGDFAIHERAHYQRLVGDGREIRAGCPGFELYFEDGSVAEARDLLRRAGVKFVHDLREQPWRQRVMRVEDPDGNIVEIGEPMEAVARRLAREGMSPEDIAAATSLPEGFIAAALAANE